MFVSVQLIDRYYSTITIKIPVVNHGELQQRISDFIQKKAVKDKETMVHCHLCKKLFQKNSCELVVFPKRKLDKKSVSCGDLLVCALSPAKGIVLCFIPSTESPVLHCAKMTQQFQEKNYPNCSEASISLFSRLEISFLIYAEGMIHVGTNDSCTLQGLDIYLLRYRNTNQTFFCQKSTSNLLIQSPFLMGEVSSDYILVDCVSKEKNFCFQIGVPIFSQAEVDVKVCSAHQSRATSLKVDDLFINTCLRFIKIFPQGSSMHHVACFPNGMFLSLPFGFIKGGKLLFSQEKKDNILKCTIISDLFVAGEKRQIRALSMFHDWQIGSSLYTQTNLSTKNIICFSDSSVTIVRKENSKEFLVVGAQLKLICSPRGIWGVYFFRDGASSSELQSEVTTFIPCTKKKSNLVMEQRPSHGVKSSLDCDPEEGPSQGAKKRSAECLGDQDLLWSSDCDPEEGPSQGAKKRSAECLGDQDLLWSSDCDPEEGPSQGAKKRSAECLGDQDLLWNLEEEASQDEKNKSKKCLGLKCADQDPLWNSASNPPFSSYKYK